MKRYFLILLLFICSTDIYGQKFPHEEWHNGRIVLIENDTIAGQIKYNLEANTVQVMPRGVNEMYAFSSHKLLYFDFIDKTSNIFRQFVILPYDIKNNNYRIPTFFEIIREGKLSLLTREKIEVVNEPYNPRHIRNISSERLVYEYFFMNEKGEIILFDGKKRSLEPIFGSYYQDIRDYIKEERLKLNRMADLAKLVAYYNQFSK